MAGKEKKEFKTFGECLRELRKERRLTLREFCRRAQLDAGNVSRIERGLLRPPSGPEIVARYAAALDLEEGSDEWHNFCDLAATSNGIIPRDLATNEDVLGVLPIFFRTLRGDKPTVKEMKALLQKIKENV